MKTMFNIKDVTKSLSFALVFGLVAVFFLSLSGFAFGVSINQFYPIAALVPGIAAIAMGVTALDSKSVTSVTDALQGMIDEISYVILKEVTQAK